MSTHHDAEPPLTPSTPAPAGSPTSAPAPGSTPSSPAATPRPASAPPSSSTTGTKPAGSTTATKPPLTPAQKREQQSMRTRTASLWVGIGVSFLVLIALVIFLMQNTEKVSVTFLGATGSAPLAIVCLISGLGVGIVVLLVGAVRIAQLRRRVKHERRP